MILAEMRYWYWMNTTILKCHGEIPSRDRLKDAKDAEISQNPSNCGTQSELQQYVSNQSANLI